VCATGDSYNLPIMKIVKRNKARCKRGQTRNAWPLSRLAQELFQSVQEAIAIQRGELFFGRRWRLTKLADGAILRAQLDVQHQSPKEA